MSTGPRRALLETRRLLCFQESSGFSGVQAFVALGILEVLEVLAKVMRSPCGHNSV